MRSIAYDGEFGEGHGQRYVWCMSNPNSAPPSGIISDESVLEALVGVKLGEGSSRDAFTNSNDPTFVIKVGKQAPYWANLTEWFIWTQIKDEPKLSDLLGRCEAISLSGRFLVMERLDDLTTDSQKASRRYPAWTNDHKPSAFGVDATGSVKIRDYGLVSLGQTLAAAPVRQIPPAVDMQGFMDILANMPDL